MHLRFFMCNDAAPNEHPQKVMQNLGITYQHATPQSIADQWWFWNCDNVPDTLPVYLEELNVLPRDAIGCGLSKEDADRIESFPLNQKQTPMPKKPKKPKKPKPKTFKPFPFPIELQEVDVHGTIACGLRQEWITANFDNGQVNIDAVMSCGAGLGTPYIILRVAQGDEVRHFVADMQTFFSEFLNIVILKVKPDGQT